MNGSTIRTFLGANSGEGFASLYETFPQQMRTVVIKGGPGSGKSGIMKKIAAQAIKQGLFVEYCYCSSDAESVDGIRIPEKNLCVVDGTPPHLAEPKYPGAKDELFYTGQFWNSQKLQKSIDDIQDLSGKIRGCFARAYRYLTASGKAVDDIRAAVLPKTDQERIKNFARSLGKRLLKKRDGKRILHPRFLSGIAPQGLILHRDTVYTLADKVYVLEDPYRISYLFLEALLEFASDLGQEMYVFYDPLCPSVVQHVAFPQDGIAFVTSDKTYSFEPQNAYKIHLERFITTDGTIKEQCRSAERFLTAGLKEALSSLKQEKAYHDDLEGFYIEAMDFKALNTHTARLIKSIF